MNKYTFKTVTDEEVKFLEDFDKTWKENDTFGGYLEGDMYGCWAHPCSREDYQRAMTIRFKMIDETLKNIRAWKKEFGYE